MNLTTEVYPSNMSAMSVESDSVSDANFKRRVKGLVAPVVASLVLLAGCSGEKDIAKYEDSKINDAEGIEICNGANVRQDPWVPGQEEGNNIVRVLDFGDAPKDACVEIEGTVYQEEDLANGPWYGVLESDLANQTGAFNPDKDDNIIWVSSQMSELIMENSSPEG